MCGGGVVQGMGVVGDVVQEGGCYPGGMLCRAGGPVHGGEVVDL